MPEKKPAKKKLTSQQQRDLDVKIGFLEGVVRRDPGYIEALQILGDDYTTRGHYQEGLGVDERLSQLRPADPLIQYNLACSYSLVKNFPSAAEALEKAILLGYEDFKWLARDPDLLNLRSHAAYKKIRALIRQIKAQKS